MANYLQVPENTEYPFLEEVYSPEGEHKIEYDLPRPSIRTKKTKTNLTLTTALCLCTA